MGCVVRYIYIYILVLTNYNPLLGVSENNPLPRSYQKPPRNHGFLGWDEMTYDWNHSTGCLIPVVPHKAVAEVSKIGNL